MPCFSSLGSPPYFCFLSTVLVITALVAAVRSQLRGFPDDSVVKNLPANRQRTDLWTRGEGRRGRDVWREAHDIVQEAVIKTIPKKTKCKKAKWLFEEALQIVEKREAKGKGEKERHTHLNAQFQRIARRWKSLPQCSMQRNRGKQ